MLLIHLQLLCGLHGFQLQLVQNSRSRGSVEIQICEN
ncbi:hypothetical protein M758_12G012700 [Ceratodon purpureus]|nr:hypothetical protein M758_12G012700 [Ceratodon purpureus]